jgi:ribosomal-protein-alanine N-acetyltransferase
MLETQRLIIRPAILEDAQNLFVMNADPEVVRYTGDSSFQNFLEAQTVIQERMISQFAKYKMSRFSVLLKDGTYLGWCGLKYHPETDEVDLGYRFMKKFWGKGYASESSLECLRYGFETLDLKRIIAKAMPDNIGSIKVLQKLGMTFRGYVNDPTDPHSFLLYDLSQEQFRRCKE